MNPHIANRDHDHRIDQVLRRIGLAIPPAGMDERIKARLARERAQIPTAPRSLFFGIPRLAFGVGATAVACFGIVAGSVYHSHIQPSLPGITGHPATDGLGAAGAARPAYRPMSPAPASRPRSVRRSTPEGRAVISPQSQKPAGVALPKTPAVQH